MYKYYDVYDRIRALNPGQIIYVDYDDTLIFHAAQEPNLPLINALKEARERGVLIYLWTHSDFYETSKRVEHMQNYGLIFDKVYCSAQKGDLIIDNLAVSP